MELTTQQKRMLLQQSIIGYSDKEVEVNFHFILEIFRQMSKKQKEIRGFEKDLENQITVEDKRNVIFRCFGAYPDDVIEETYKTAKEDLAAEAGLSLDEFELKAFEYFKYHFEADQENFFKKNN